jgi:diguanylate cyclase (GGDEF)-like protein/PAS domain S-box-containing protein
MLGMPLLAFINEEWQSLTIAALTYVQRRVQGSKESFDFQLRRKDGSNLWAIVSANPIFDAAGQYAGALGMFTDITRRKQAEVEIQQSEQKYRNLFDNSLVGMFRSSLTDGTVLDANAAILRMFGFDSYEGIRTVSLYINPTDRETLNQLVLEQGFVENFETQVRRKDGSVFWVSYSAKLYAKEDYLEGVMIDITERKQSEEALRAKKEFLKVVLGNIPQFIFWKDRNSVYLGCNQNFAIAAGLSSPEKIVGLTDYDLPWKKQEADFFRECDARIMETDTPEYHIIAPQLQADGKQAWLDTTKIPLHDAQGNVVGILGSYEDITERQFAQEKIRYQALHDLLTGLPNRTLFNEELSVSLANAANSQSLLAVMFLDLDRFKTINDTLGHAIGDRLLQGVAERLTTCLQDSGIVARWGGDELTVLLPQLNCIEEAAKVAQRILDTIKQPFNLEGHQLHISSSIGIALYPQNGEDAETLLRNADASLYRVKQQGRNNYQFYTAAMNSQASELLVLENELHHALDRGEFVVHYQPQVNTTTGEITGMEALVRWQHPKFGLVTPAKFIPLAEETGLIVPIGEWVLKTACTQNKAWQDAGLPPLRVAVNLSARQFQQPFLLNIVSQTLQQTGLSPKFLELEITETIAMQDVDLTRTILTKLYQMGINLSIDDFGTGYSSLGYLKQFPLHSLKIDKSFVRDVATDPQNAGIINAIMTLGRGFNLRVIAEGVETEAEKDWLRSFQCEEMQGYLSSPPLPALQATELLQNSHSMTAPLR